MLLVSLWPFCFGLNDMMTYSKQGVALTESFEGCPLKAYWDAKGKCWTIGHGHTGPDVHEGLVWTQAQADSALLIDIHWAELVVNHMVTVQLTQCEFDALVDFVFNGGSGNFQSSTLLKLVDQGQFAQAALEFDKWDHSGGQVVAGLLRRRQAETDLFLKTS